MIVFDEDQNECVLDIAGVTDREEPLTVAVIYDLSDNPWARDLIEFTMELLLGGGFREIWPDFADMPNFNFNYEIYDSKNSEYETTRAYWNLRTKNGGRPPHGIIGARRSDDSIALARIGRSSIV